MIDNLAFMLDPTRWPFHGKCCLKRWTRDDRTMEFATLVYEKDRFGFILESAPAMSEWGTKELVERLVEEGWLVD